MNHLYQPKERNRSRFNDCAASSGLLNWYCKARRGPSQTDAQQDRTCAPGPNSRGTIGTGRTFRLWLPIGVVAAAGCAVARAGTLAANPANYQRLLATVLPGDTLLLAPGVYEHGLSLAHVGGDAARPIVVRGPVDRSAVFRARLCCNTVQLNGTSHISIENLTLDGGGLDGPFAVDSRGASSYITLANLLIVHHGATQQDVAISTKGPAWNWTIRGNTIIGAGTGLYLGNSDGTDPFVAGLIEDNLIVDTLGYNLEIKHQVTRPEGVGLPADTSRTIIRGNVFSKLNNATAGRAARPNVLVGHFPLSGQGAQDRYEIYGNLFYENPGEALFQGEGNIALYDNVFITSHGDAVSIRPQNDRPRAIAVFYNTVVARGRGISVLGGLAGSRENIFGNAVFSGSLIVGPNQSNNTAEPYATASQSLVAPFAPIGAVDVHPRTGRLAGSPMDPAIVSQFTDATYDFDGCPRSWRYQGAYDGQTPVGAWLLALARMPPRELRHVCSRQAGARAERPAPAVGATPSP